MAIVGCGTAGPAAALLLARDGHEVEIFERARRAAPASGPGSCSSGSVSGCSRTWAWPTSSRRRSSPVRRVDARTPSGRRVLDFAYDEVVLAARTAGAFIAERCSSCCCGAVRGRRDPDPNRRRGRSTSRRTSAGWRLADERIGGCRAVRPGRRSRRRTLEDPAPQPVWRRRTSAIRTARSGRVVPDPDANRRPTCPDAALPRHPGDARRAADGRRPGVASSG